MVSTKALLEALQLEPVGPDRYQAGNVAGAPGVVVFGGQLMAQSIVAAALGHEGKSVKTLHIVFARGASAEAPLDVAVEPMQSGRTFASSTVTISQGDRLCTRAIVLLTAEEPDLIRHGIEAPVVPGPEAASPAEDSAPDDGPEGWEIGIVGGVDIADPDAVGPATLDVWTRFAGAPDDPATGRALLAFASDGFLIGTAMRPHAGVGQAQAHHTLSTGVVSHTITFHEPFSAADWLLLAHSSPYAGHGRGYGRADVFRSDGQLVASYVQDSMIRPMPEGSRGTL